MSILFNLSSRQNMCFVNTGDYSMPSYTKQCVVLSHWHVPSFNLTVFHFLWYNIYSSPWCFLNACHWYNTKQHLHPCLCNGGSKPGSRVLQSWSFLSHWIPFNWLPVGQQILIQIESNSQLIKYKFSKVMNIQKGICVIFPNDTYHTFLDA